MASLKNGKPLLPSKRKALDEQPRLSHLEAEAEAEAEAASIIPSRQRLKHVVDSYVNKYHRVFSPPHLHGSSEDSPYPHIPGLPNAYHIFNLHRGGLPEEKRSQAISSAKEYHATQKSNFMGYQLNQALNYQLDFASYMDIHVNNIGDAFKEGNMTVNSKFMERAVLDYYAALWHATWPHSDNDPDSYWGFCLTMGSTEGNLYGMWNARDYLSGKKILVDDKASKIVRRKAPEGHTESTRVNMPRLMYHAAPKPMHSPHAYTPIAFFSEDTHYSLSKAMTMLEVRTFHAEGMQHYPGECPVSDNGEWPVEVPSDTLGAMDLEALVSLVEFFASRGYPILVCFNYGTTFKGAYDDVALACDKLKPILMKYGLLERKVHYDENDPTKVDMRTGYWFHVDGALGAAYLPFIEMAFDGGLVENKGPTFDFRLPMVHSIAMSGHKWIGAPVPCGVYMTKTKYQMLPPEIPEYIGSPDTTFAGSRSGLTPMLLWDNIARNSFEDQIAKALRLEDLGAYIEKRLLELQEKLEEDLYVERTPLALTVRFKRVNEELCKKYSLSNEDLNGRRYTHVFMMEHVTHELVNELIKDLSKEGAFAPQLRRAPATVVDKALLAPLSHKVAHVPHQGRGFHGSSLS